MVRPASLMLAALLLLPCCSRRYVRPESIAPDVTDLHVRDRSAGTCFRCVSIDGVVWATDGRAIQLLDARGNVMREVEFGETGADAPIVDLAVSGDQVVLVFDRDQVQVLDVSDPRHPVTTRREQSQRLGLEPRGVAMIDGAPMIFGDDGAVTLDDLEHVVRGEAVTSMASATDGGWYVTARRIKRIRGGAYVGTASLLAASPTGACAFVRNEGDAALLGLLGPDAHEVDPARLTKAVPSRVSRMHFDGDMLLAIADDGLHVWRLRDGALQSMGSWAQPGLRDAAVIEGDRVLAVGEHGRSILDLHRSTGREVRRHETPGGLSTIGPAAGGLVASGAAGGWSFIPGREVVRINGAVPAAEPPRQGTVLDWSIDIDSQGKARVLTPLGETSLAAPGGGGFSCVATTGSAFWLGHDRGIERIAPPSMPPAMPSPEEGETVDPMLGASRMSVRLGGPVLGCTPLVLGRGVAYATAHDGFGMVVERKGHVHTQPVR